MYGLTSRSQIQCSRRWIRCSEHRRPARRAILPCVRPDQTTRLSLTRCSQFCSSQARDEQSLRHNQSGSGSSHRECGLGHSPSHLDPIPPLARHLPTSGKHAIIHSSIPTRASCSPPHIRVPAQHNHITPSHSLPTHCRPHTMDRAAE